MADAFEAGIGVAPCLQSAEDQRQPGCVAHNGGDIGAVEVGAEGDVLVTHQVHDVVEVADDDIERGIGVRLHVGAKKDIGEVDADGAALVRQRLDLAVVEVADVRRDGFDA